MGKRRNKFHSNCFSCDDDLQRAGLGSGIAVKESSFQALTTTTTTFPVLITLDDAVTTTGIEFLRNGVSSGLQTTTGGIYDIAYIVSSTVTTTTGVANTLLFELVTSTGRVIADSTATQFFPAASVAGFSANTNLELALNARLFPGESVSIVLRSITPLISAGTITINTASLFISPTPTIEEFRDESTTSCFIESSIQPCKKSSLFNGHRNSQYRKR
ncbi:hypothetical protein ABE65_009995 [Fictibacillus phosphorivorans]|uniref:Uncharacterized protein n=1 Tax=Fictibacillus phosphorivorans TaxID=1221500 RepID=A0A160ILY5_9BACL|nr:hypothetical protein [Fictibacillus phosphorivorans]ANC77114.1 hypothetical protein ABE65_009995 [Fictibacillus phosphorivorans]